MSDKNVKAWGDGENGQLGTNYNGRCDPDQASACATIPLNVPGVRYVKAIAARGDHSMALLSDGKVMAWGANFFGQLGDGMTSANTACTDDELPLCSEIPVSVAGLSHVKAIAAGDLFSLALLK